MGRSEPKHESKQSKQKRSVSKPERNNAFCLFTSKILFEETLFRLGLLVKFEKHLVSVLQDFLLKVDIFLLIPFSFLHIFNMF